jgi:hypothetical protein
VMRTTTFYLDHDSIIICFDKLESWQILIALRQEHISERIYQKLPYIIRGKKFSANTLCCGNSTIKQAVHVDMISAVIIVPYVHTVLSHS